MLSPSAKNGLATVPAPVIGTFAPVEALLNVQPLAVSWRM